MTRQLSICVLALLFSAASGARAASRCYEAVQGEIAWNYSGATRWNPSNVERLCDGAEGSEEPARCFERVMHGRVDWGGGTRWKWSDAVDLCQGTRDSAATVRCFEREVGDGASRRRAIEACQGGGGVVSSGELVTDLAVPLDPEVVGDIAVASRVDWSAGSGWERVGDLGGVTQVAACEDVVFALAEDGRLYERFTTEAAGEWRVSHEFDREIQSLVCNRGLRYLDARRRLYAGTKRIGRPYAAADLAAAEAGDGHPSRYYALNDDRTLWENRGGPEDAGWRKIGRPADAKRLAAAREALFALNDDGSFHVMRKPGDSRYWHRLGTMEGAVDVSAVYAPEIDGALAHREQRREVLRVRLRWGGLSGQQGRALRASAQARAPVSPLRHPPAGVERRGGRAGALAAAADAPRLRRCEADPPDEAVIVAGDLNIDKRSRPREYRRMLCTLEVAQPEESGPRFSFDPVTNDLASEADPDARREYLDYVLYSRRHRRPEAGFTEVRFVRAAEPWRDDVRDLSDHHAVWGAFVFE